MADNTNETIEEVQGTSFILPDDGNEITDNDISQQQLRVTVAFKKYFPNVNCTLTFLHGNNSHSVRFTHREGRSHVLKMTGPLMTALKVRSNRAVKLTKLGSKKFQIEPI